PIHLLLVHKLFEILEDTALLGDADQRERLAFKLFDERPLVGPHGPSDASVLAPEVKQYYFATVVAHLYFLAVLVLALDLRHLPAYRQIADLKHRTIGYVTDLAVSAFHVSIFFRGPCKQTFGLLCNCVPVLAHQILECLFP